MIKYKIKNSDTKIILKKDNYCIDNCDIIINWITPSINGPASYKQFLENSGEQIHYHLIGMKDYVKPSDAFTTHAGFLPATIAINCVMPDTPAMYNDCFFKIKETINTYHRLDNLSRFITLTIPDINYKEFVYHFNSYVNELSFVQEFRIIVDHQTSFDKLKKELNKYYSEDEKLINKIIKLFKKK